MTGFGKIGLNAANNFFQYPRVKPYGSIFFKKKIMAEKDRDREDDRQEKERERDEDREKIEEKA